MTSELDIQDLEEIDISQTILDKYTKEVKTQLPSFNDDNKLRTYSKLYNTYTCQTYLTFDVPKSVTRELAKLRIGAHDLVIERGRYFRPKHTRGQRLCSECKQIDGEYILSYSVPNLKN